MDKDPRKPPRLFASDEEAWRFALDAAADAERRTGCGIGYMSAVDRIMPLEAARRRVDSTLAQLEGDKHMIATGVPCIAAACSQHAGSARRERSSHQTSPHSCMYGASFSGSAMTVRNESVVLV
jgi:hypothetical protein